MYPHSSTDPSPSCPTTPLLVLFFSTELISARHYIRLINVSADFLLPAQQGEVREGRVFCGEHKRKNKSMNVRLPPTIPSPSSQAQTSTIFGDGVVRALSRTRQPLSYCATLTACCTHIKGLSSPQTPRAAGPAALTDPETASTRRSTWNARSIWVQRPLPLQPQVFMGSAHGACAHAPTGRARMRVRCTTHMPPEGRRCVPSEP